MEIFNKNDIDVSDMDVSYVQGKKPRWLATTSMVSNMNNCKHDILFIVLDLQLHELNVRFGEENTKLLQCVSCLSPLSLLVAFDVKKMIENSWTLSKWFIDVSEVVVRHQLQNYVRNVWCAPTIENLKGLSNLCAKLVETNKCNTFYMVYKILKLALVLLIATTRVEHVFSTMKFVKGQLCNKMSDQCLNDYLVTFIKEVFLKQLTIMLF